CGKHERAQQMVAAIQAGAMIDASYFGVPTPFWTEYIQQLKGKSWKQLPFFDVEFVFYHGLNSLVDYYSDHTAVVFEKSRADALTKGLSVFPARYEALPTTDTLASVLQLSVSGNQADYSQLRPIQEERLATDVSLLCNDISELVTWIETVSGTIHL